MKLLLVFVTLFLLSIISCTYEKEDNLEFGRRYNPSRQEFNAPLIQDNMIANKCCKDYPIYEIDEIPSNNSAYHYSKSVTGILDHKITSEKDIYKKSVDDST